MFYIYLLIFVEVFLLVIALIISKKNLLSPGVITMTMFLVATLCVAVNKTSWDVDYSGQAFLITSIGLSTMVLAEAFVIFMVKPKIGSSGVKNIKVPSMRLDRSVNFILSLICAILTFYYAISVFRSGLSSGIEGLYAIGAAKYGNEPVGFLNKIALRYDQILFYVSVFFLARNVIAYKEKLSKNKCLLFNVFLYFLMMLVSGNRMGIFRNVISIYVMFVIFTYVVEGTISKRIGSITKKLFVVLVVGVALFYGMRTISKIGSYTGERSFFEYITYYVGSPVYLFSKYLDNPLYVHPQNVYLGEECFTGIYDSFGITVNGSNNFINVGGTSSFAGNACSWFQRPMNDFGFVGMLFFTFIIYFTFSYFLYKKILGSNRMSVGSIVIFSFMFYIVVMSFYYCQTSWAITLNNVLVLFVICLAIRYLPKIRMSGTVYNNCKEAKI
jgi:oligosaccharide repeat unit polymerase